MWKSIASSAVRRTTYAVARGSIAGSIRHAFPAFGVSAHPRSFITVSDVVRIAVPYSSLQTSSNSTPLAFPSLSVDKKYSGGERFAISCYWFDSCRDIRYVPTSTIAHRISIVQARPARAKVDSMAPGAHERLSSKRCIFPVCSPWPRTWKI